MGRAEAFPGNCALFPGLPFLWSPWLSTPKTADEPLPTVGLERDTDTSWRVGSQHLGKGIMTLWRPAFHPQPLVHKTAGRRLGRGSRGPPSPSPPPVPPAEKSAGSAQGWLQPRALFQPLPRPQLTSRSTWAGSGLQPKAPAWIQGKKGMQLREWCREGVHLEHLQYFRSEERFDLTCL